MTAMRIDRALGEHGDFMTQEILRRVVDGPLPMQFFVPTDIDRLQDLRDAGYLKVSFAPIEHESSDLRHGHGSHAAGARGNQILRLWVRVRCATLTGSKPRFRVVS